MRRILTIVLVAFAAISFYSCNKLQELYAPLETEWIRFEAGDVEASGSMETKALENEITCDITDWDYVEEGEQTKAKLTETLSGSVGVYGYNFTSWTGSEKPTVMSNEKSSFSGSSLTTENKHLWKDCKAENVRFYAYAPYGKFTVSGKDDAGVPYLTFTVPTDNSKQADILYAQSEDISKDNRNAVPLQFKHAMCAVQFRLGIADATLNSVTVSKVKNSGKLSLDGTWSNLSGSSTYTITNKDSLLLMIPQTLATGATVTLNYTPKGGSETNISASIAGQMWEKGKKVVYTLKEASGGETDYIYFDLAAGPISIGSEAVDVKTYKGYVYVDGTAKEISGTHKGANKYYVYQSTDSNKSSTGYRTDAEYEANKNIANHVCRVPSYPDITVDGKKWKDFITNNQDLESVITTFDTKAAAAGRTYCDNYFIVTAVTEEDKNVEIVLDNIWMHCYQVRLNRVKDHEPGYDIDRLRNGTFGDIIMYACSGSSAVKTQAKYILKGDNRIFHMLIPNNKYVSATFTSFQGDGFDEGTLVAAPTTKFENIIQGVSVLGSNDRGFSSNSTSDQKNEYNTLTFNGGTIFASDPLMSSDGAKHDEIMNDENWCWSVIGGGGNTHSYININGGTITALSHSTGAAIGGGGGHIAQGGRGYVTIKGGKTYAYSYGAYSLARSTFVPITAIGGGGSVNAEGNSGTVTINGGYVYAESRGGCAIGGSNSPSNPGGFGIVTIEGGEIYAKSISGSIKDNNGNTITINQGVAIGGGNGTTGGKATVTINNGKCYTGSVGGGKSVLDGGVIGSADIHITGGETSGQFIMAAGASIAPSFTMTGGTLKNSSTTDTSFKKVQSNGGAVYIESGSCTISGGTISGCSATLGGAVYMNGGKFEMTGGTIAECEAKTSGGAVYIEGGNATVSGGEVYHNIASEGDGGGIAVLGGNFTMPTDGTGKIINNAAYENKTTHKYGSGGGIYVASTTSDPEVKLLGGEIAHNASDRNGGGLCVDMSETNTHKATITIGNVEVEKRDVYSPNIHSNSAALSGGGMSVQGKGSNITIYSGTVKGNVSAFVKNEDIRNDGGMVSLVGKNEEGKTAQVDVLYNTITYYANNEKDPEPYAEQRVITSTNSPLDPASAGALDFKMEFFHIASWNTKRDGTGTRYPADGTGAVMNITSDVSLYAQWVGN